MNINRFLFCVFFVLFTNGISKAQNDCVYDDSIITDDFLKASKQIEFYKWNESEKEGTAILSDGITLNVKKWACNHIGTSANMMIIKEQFNIDSWKKYIKQLATIVCNQRERQIIENKLMSISSFETINEKNCKKEIDISNERYPEFYISIYNLEDTIVLSIFYYETP